MTDKAPKSRAEIEQLLLCELQSSGGCAGAAGISIVSRNRSQFENANWTIAMFNAGTASDYECERELMKIVPRFQGCYDLVQKH